MRCHILTEYRRKLRASAAFRSGSESSDGPLPPPSVHFRLFRYSIPSQKTGNTLVTPLGLQTLVDFIRLADEAPSHNLLPPTRRVLRIEGYCRHVLYEAPRKWFNSS
ncbi:hypothetical protein EVAR_47219_1 [Eumeta japonica]|uniref:Uncharacterized protein n=1 Tax=Eumeta variegata TaxID=151549 RepID=A0A4C1XYB7_EUMVA|nr:hypothetical protein EVAR_47219_1 [Eumeta japonica]